MFFFLGLMMMVIGISEFKVKRQGNAVLCILVSIIVLFVSIFYWLE
ncbi:YczI family protein [Terribacillus sp. AE2B 122]|nr:YczI family protein [Terribacillus sp. AE2B 122]